jgi:predicted flap endonuclease-1-like 5' DNA nuclease
LAVCWLMRGRCPLIGREDPARQTAGDASPSLVNSPEDEIGVTATAVADLQTQPRRIVVLTEIEGIAPSDARELEARGLRTTDDLLQAGAGPKGREDLAAATGISGKLILRWVNMADLFRIKGVGEEYSDLLEAAGVDSVPELARRRADNLTKKMAEVNEQKRLVRRLPTEDQVTGWIESAKGLPRVVTY